MPTFMEMLKGFGYAIGAVFLVALWVVPDLIGKLVPIWHFFRGDRFDED